MALYKFSFLDYRITITLAFERIIHLNISFHFHMKRLSLYASSVVTTGLIIKLAIFDYVRLHSVFRKRFLLWLQEIASCEGFGVFSSIICMHTWCLTSHLRRNLYLSPHASISCCCCCCCIIFHLLQRLH